MSKYVCGSIPWYSNAVAFAGFGIIKNGIVFSYKANWKSVGRWSVEILTKEHKFPFEPMEQFKAQNRGEIIMQKQQDAKCSDCVNKSDGTLTRKLGG